MEIYISNSGTKPIYEQITDQIKAAILAGKLAEGEALPSIRFLAKELGISVITMLHISRVLSILFNRFFIFIPHFLPYPMYGHFFFLQRIQMIVITTPAVKEAMPMVTYRSAPFRSRTAP